LILSADNPRLNTLFCCRRRKEKGKGGKGTERIAVSASSRHTSQFTLIGVEVRYACAANESPMKILGGKRGGKREKREKSRHKSRPRAPWRERKGGGGGGVKEGEVAR